jgi:8-oxo-dGTP diphosphatase
MLKKLLGKFWRKSPRSLRRILTRTTQTTFTVSVGAIVVNAEGKILLLDHVLRPASGWGIPGGFIKAGEQPKDALQREICEEIGLKIENLELYKTQTLRRHVEIIFIARARAEGEVQSFEINKIGWFYPDKMPREMDSKQKNFIKEAFSKLNLPRT